MKKDCHKEATLERLSVASDAIENPVREMEGRLTFRLGLESLNQQEDQEINSGRINWDGSSFQLAADKLQPPAAECMEHLVCVWHVCL